MATNKEQLDELRLEKEQLEMILLRSQIAEIKAKGQSQATKHNQVEKDLADRRDADKFKQDNCNHRHGGQGMAAIQGQGDDSKFALVKHRLPLGNIHIHCVRCGKEWDKVLDYKGMGIGYTPGKDEYNWALTAPALSTMSEASQFRIELNNAQL